ncbi:hypothetical protein TNCV_1172991 [Trichonephila clavipes]|uniref:Uncharacterized protein n=1 Tax=Trichonephila clavipes TaxID=2585209 RepID=A0A8X6RZ19_TRICX|nr:hypothetical protein TNCV_1172991 [Trichonephila clavipes]
MVDSWKTLGGPITGYLLLGPCGLKKCGIYPVETVHRDRNSVPPTWPWPQKSMNASSRQLFETSGGCGSPVVKVSDHGRHVMSSSPIPLKTRREGARCMLNLSRAQTSFRSDEAQFWLNGYVNKQNCRIWSEANPQVYVETPLHPEKLTVWCALWAGGILLQKR